MSNTGGHAVVLGAGIAGLLAARVLSDSHRTVTIVERDRLTDTPDDRQGVPQGRHAHLLMRRGSMVLSELFPGILDDLASEGAPVWDDGDLSKLNITFGGRQILRSGHFSDLFSTKFFGLTRPFLEYHVRRRVLALPNVTTLQQRDVLELTSTAERDRVTGVRIAERDSGASERLDADLVVDATGRGSRTPVFLEELGYQRPAEDELVVRMHYSSERYRIPPGTLHEQVYLRGPEADNPWSLGLHKGEQEIWMLTIQGRMGHRPPADHAGMLRFATDFASDHIVAALHRGCPVGDVARHGISSNRWRRYDKLRRLPAGLLVVGDAICSFNPVYGQGITVAALDALVLRDCLLEGEADLPRRYFAATARMIAVAWQMSVGADMALPDVMASPPVSARISNAYTELVQSAAQTDVEIAETFWKVIHLVEMPDRLLRPGIMARVFLVNLGRLVPRAFQVPGFVRLAAVGRRKRA